MQLSKNLTNILIIAAICFVTGSYGSCVRNIDSSTSSNENSIEAATTNENITFTFASSTNDTGNTFFSEAHVTFSNRYESTFITPQEEAYFDNALILAFEQSKTLLLTQTQATTNVFMINAQIMSEKSINATSKQELKIGSGLRRSLRFRPRRYHHYRVYDYSILMDFGCGNLCGDKSGFWDRRRYLKQSLITPPLDKFAATFGRKICKILRGAPYDIFKTVKNCCVHFGL